MNPGAKIEPGQVCRIGVGCKTQNGGRQKRKNTRDARFHFVGIGEREVQGFAKESFDPSLPGVNSFIIPSLPRTMKKPNILLTSRLLTLAASLIGALAISAQAADEKPDVGPPPSPEETKAIDELTKHGVFAGPIAAGYNWRSVNFRGVDKADAAIYGQLKFIPSIVEIDLAGAHLGPTDLANISNLKNLKKVNLSSSNVTDDELAALEKMEKLEWLNLFSTGITDAGLAHLAGIKTLHRLYLFETKVTDAGVDTLKKASPTLSIDRGWDKNPPAPVAAAEPKKPEPAAAPKPEEKKPAAPAPPATPPAPPAVKPPAPAPATPPAPAPATTPPAPAPANPPAAPSLKPATPAPTIPTTPASVTPPAPAPAIPPAQPPAPAPVKPADSPVK